MPSLNQPSLPEPEPESGEGSRGDREITTTGTNWLRHYFTSRWRGSVPLGRLLFSDMLILGTLINLVTTLASLAVLGSGAPTWAGLAVFLLPMPYNLFIFACVWRLAGQIGGFWGTSACVIAALWLAGATVL